MQLAGNNLVNPAPVLSYYSTKGLYTDLLSKCNCQEFRFIDGYGKGYFLSTALITTETASFTVGDRTCSLKILDRLSLEHPSAPAGLYCYITAEPKYKLSEYVVRRSYNITVDKSLSQTDPPTVLVMETGGTPLTLQEVIETFLGTDYTLVYNATELYCYDINIEGMSYLKALDKLCSTYGLVWTADATNVYIWDLTGSDSSSDTVLGTYSNAINNIHWTQLNPAISDISVSFPVYNYNRQVPREFYTFEDDTSGGGKVINVYDPYYPAVINIDGTLRNQALLDARGTTILENLESIQQTMYFLEKHHFEANSLDISPVSLSEIHGDFGYGPRSIFRSIPYPYNTPIYPEAKSRYANNWRGTLAYAYNGVVSHFIVTPVVGLDGKIPPASQRVENVYGWDYGEVGWNIRVEWNPVQGVWEGLQQWYECPPDVEPPPYEPPPPEDPYILEPYEPE